MEKRGQYAVRGGILDLFGWDQIMPVRTEWFGDTVESIRTFDLDEQKAIAEQPSFGLVLQFPDGSSGFLSDYVGANDLSCALDTDLKTAAVRISIEAATEAGEGAVQASFLDWLLASAAGWQESTLGREVGIERGSQRTALLVQLRV